MKKNKALLTNPDTSNGEIAMWTRKYDIVIRPSLSLDEKSTAFSGSPEIIAALSDAKIPFPDYLDEPSPVEVCPFTFNTHLEATAFLTEHRLVIGYDHIDSIDG